MAQTDDTCYRLRAPKPTPAEEICSCPTGTPAKLVGGPLWFNPIHCLNCNLEVPPDRLGIDSSLAEAIADWQSTYAAIDMLELASGEYEAWARSELLNVNSPPNREGWSLSVA